MSDSLHLSSAETRWLAHLVASGTRWTASDASAVLALQERSGLSVTAFAVAVGLCGRRLYHWRSALGSPAIPGSAAPCPMITSRLGHPPGDSGHHPWIP